MDNRIGSFNLASKLPFPKGAESKKQDEVKTEAQAPQVSFGSTNTDEVLKAMNLISTSSKAHHGLNGIDPAKYLSADRIADIQNSMVAFQGGVDKKRAELDKLTEFTGLPEATKNAIAAQALVQEQEKTA